MNHKSTVTPKRPRKKLPMITMLKLLKKNAIDLGHPTNAVDLVRKNR